MSFLAGIPIRLCKFGRWSKSTMVYLSVARYINFASYVSYTSRTLPNLASASATTPWSGAKPLFGLMTISNISFAAGGSNWWSSTSTQLVTMSCPCHPSKLALLPSCHIHGPCILLLLLILHSIGCIFVSQE